eukprot:scaffold78033_cov23-Tisochrysis_lutea.AAC.1
MQSGHLSMDGVMGWGPWDHEHGWDHGSEVWLLLNLLPPPSSTNGLMPGDWQGQWQCARWLRACLLGWGIGSFRSLASGVRKVCCDGKQGEPGQENRVRAKNEKVEAFLFSAT